MRAPGAAAIRRVAIIAASWRAPFESRTPQVSLASTAALWLHLSIRPSRAARGAPRQNALDAAMPLTPKRFADELKALFQLAAPIAAAQAGIATMGLVDVAVVGRKGATALGALGLANGLFFALAVLGMGTMMGLDPLLAQAVGAGDRRRARELVWQGAWLAAFATAVLAVPVALSPLLLEPAGVSRELAEGARGFLWWRLVGLYPLLVFVGLRSYLQAAGAVRVLVVSTVVANLANFVLDVYFVFGGAGLPAWTGPLRLMPSLGAPGAGLATSLGAILQVAILLSAARHVDEHVGGVQRGLHAADVRLAARVGLPVGLQMGAEVGVFALAGVLAGRMGAESLAAHQVALQLASFTFSAALGVGAAGSVRVGWAIGAGDGRQARRSGLVAFAAGAMMMSVSALAFWLLPRQLARLLTDKPDIIAGAAPLLAIAAVFQLFDGVQGVGAGVLRGAGQTRFAFVANVVGHYGIGLPIAIALGFWLRGGIAGVWWGLCAGLVVVAVALFARFWVVSSRPMAALEPRGPPAA